MTETPSSSDENTSKPIYETPALREYGTLLTLTLGATGFNPETVGGVPVTS